VSGIEDRDVRGHSAETVFNSAGPIANVDAGGRQRTVGLFGQDTIQFRRGWLLTVGGRLDTWLNSRGFSNRTPLTGGAANTSIFSDRSETAFSPRVSLLHAVKNVAVSASFYRAFRAPTLNELYRNFRVGNIVTNANSSLRAERLAGGEAGVSLQTWSERLILRGVFFWSEISDPIANVTVSTTPTLITRQRQNLGRIRALGIEVSALVSLSKGLRLSAEYLLTDSTVVSFPADVALKGLKVPQVPKDQLNIQLSYTRHNWITGLQGRFVGRQFDDDQNVLPLAGFFNLDAEISRRVSRHLKVFAAAQNLTGVRYQTGRTPVLTVGPPLLARVGIRIDF